MCVVPLVCQAAWVWPVVVVVVVVVAMMTMMMTMMMMMTTMIQVLRNNLVRRQPAVPLDHCR